MQTENIIKNIDNQLKNDSHSSLNVDFDRLKEKHNKRIIWLNNLYDLITHKTIILIFATILFVAFIVTRYILVSQKEQSNLLVIINKDLETAIKYFVTVVITNLFTRYFEK